MTTAMQTALTFLIQRADTATLRSLLEELQPTSHARGEVEHELDRRDRRSES